MQKDMIRRNDKESPKKAVAWDYRTQACSCDANLETVIRGWGGLTQSHLSATPCPQVSLHGSHKVARWREGQLCHEPADVM